MLQTRNSTGQLYRAVVVDRLLATGRLPRLEGGEQQAQGGVCIFDLGRCFDGSDHVTKHRDLAIVKPETELEPTSKARVSWGLGLLLAAPDPKCDRVGQRTFIRLERVELKLAEGHGTGCDGAERAPAAAGGGADLPRQRMPTVDGSGGQCPIAPHGRDGDFE